MRLLHSAGGSGNDFNLVEFHGEDIPPYAILSHTWGPDQDEVTYKDIVERTWDGKPGVKKLAFCKEQVKRNGLQYFWVDTCCIDKSSSAELSEAINSMFRWYQNASICYVYLPDTPPPTFGVDDWNFQSKTPRWFTRGWTLQELLAPKRVGFYIGNGQRIGDKSSLEKVLCDVTKIPPAALKGNKPLSEFSVEERLSWAANRQTKREEDAVYSLLGIFGVFMPPIYGEGKVEALRRLRKLIKEKSEDDSLSLNGLQISPNPTPQIYQASFPQVPSKIGSDSVEQSDIASQRVRDVTATAVINLPEGGDTFIFYIARGGVISYIRRSGGTNQASRVVIMDGTQKPVLTRSPSLAATVYKKSDTDKKYQIRLFYIDLEGFLNGVVAQGKNAWRPLKNVHGKVLQEKQWRPSPRSGLSVLGSLQLKPGNIEIYFRDRDNRHKLTRVWKDSEKGGKGGDWKKRAVE